VDFCVEYVQKKPYVDFLHLWLADSVNNNCECENCVKMTPSDHYVVLLNEIEEALTAIGAKTRLVFILYTDTSRAPEIMRLKHPERFILTVAFGTNYERGYLVEKLRGEDESPFERNHYKNYPLPLRIYWHDKWKAQSNNIDSFVYEYRFYTDHYCDPGYMRVARETHRDMCALKNVSFQGCMSDQTHRNFMPTALPMLLMGETLFDASLDPEAYINGYFAAAFGADGAPCRAYLEALSKLFCPSNLRASYKNLSQDAGLNTLEKKAPIHNNPWVAEQLRQIPGVIEDFLPVIRRNLAAKNAAQRLSWQYLEQHAQICQYLARLFLLAAEGKIDEARSFLLEEVELYLSREEMRYHRVYDRYLLVQFLRGLVGIKREKAYQ
jgi:hypothetical protein